MTQSLASEHMFDLGAEALDLVCVAEAKQHARAVVRESEARRDLERRVLSGAPC